MNTSKFNKDKILQSLVYFLKPKEKKEIRISFAPKFIHQKEKFMVRFES